MSGTICAAGLGPAVGGDGAVHFDGMTQLLLSSMSCVDSHDFSFAGWFNINWADSVNFPVAFVVDPLTTYVTFLTTQFFSPSHYYPTFGVGDTGGGDNQRLGIPGVTTGWHHIIGTVHASSPVIFKVYVDDVDNSSGPTQITGAHTFNVACNGLQMMVGGDTFGDWFIGDMCDLSVWPNVSFLHGSDMDVSIRRLFIDGSGHRVMPSVAIATLGSPPVMLHGGASSFAHNSLGTNGAFSVYSGALTDASTLPP